MILSCNAPLYDSIMKLSKFGEKFTASSGIQILMDDIGTALASEQPMIMMGGGNPAAIPQIEDEFNKQINLLARSPRQTNRFFSSYDPPQGNPVLIDSLCGLLRKQLGWDIKAHNIALTNGSQSAFFMLFNFFAGSTCSDNNADINRQIQLPLAPEYIGYGDAGIQDNCFIAVAPQMEMLEQREFKYHVKFDDICIDETIGAICVSRPTNPTGNVITDDELEQLDALAKIHGVPLIVDGAYGLPFPGLVFTQATPFWNQNTIICLSLSKLGLPSARTGIVVANEEVIQGITRANAIINLASGNIGAALTHTMVASGEIINLSKNVIRPHYEAALAFAQQKLHDYMGADIPWRMHKPEGTMFVWLWFQDLPISSQILYERLKHKGVIVVSGHHFFLGIQETWQHRHECIRINYASQNLAKTDTGLKIISETVRQAYLDD